MVARLHYNTSGKSYVARRARSFVLSVLTIPTYIHAIQTALLMMMMVFS